MKLVKPQISRLYELTFLVPAVYTDSELKDIQKEIEALIKKYKGSVENTEEWGKKNLAYKIKKAGKTYTEAFYYHYQLEFPAEKVQEFEKFLYINNKIIRHLLVVADSKTEEAPADKADKVEKKEKDEAEAAAK